MGVVEEPVTDGIGEGRLADVVVPLGRWQLAGDDRRPCGVAILEDLQDDATILILEWSEGPVVDEQPVNACELAEEADVGAIGASQGQLVEEARGPAIEGAVALAAGLVREGTGQEALPRPGHPADEDPLVFVDPATSGELADDGFVELAPRGIVDRLEARLRELQLGVLEGAGQALVLPGAPLGLDEESKALVEGEGRHVGLLLLLRPGRRHGRELERVELFDRGGVEHGLLLSEEILGDSTAGEGLGAFRSAFLEAGHTSLSPFLSTLGRGGGRRRRRSVRVLVVLPSAEMLVGGEQRELRRGRRPREPVEAVLEDRVDVAVGAGVDADGAGTGGLEPSGAVAFGEPQDPETGAVALLRGRPGGENGLGQRGGLGARRAWPGGEPRGWPLEGALMVSSSSAMRALRAAREKKRSWRRRARIQRSTISTPTSIFALSRGCAGRAGRMTVPKCCANCS